MPLLEARDLGFRRADRWILRSLFFALEPGEALGVVGPSGTGKTTLFRLLLGLLEPTEGSVHFEGAPWSGMPEGQRRPRRPRIQAIFQDVQGSLPPHRTGWELLEEPLRLHGSASRSQAREAAAEMAARVGFPEAQLGQRPGEWSGGLAQRLALGRALMTGPKVLVLDEPLSALDPTLGQHLLALLLELKREGTALVFISHQLRAVTRLCERVLVLEGGAVEMVDVDALEENVASGVPIR